MSSTAAGEHGSFDVRALVDRADGLNDRGEYQAGLQTAQEAIGLAPTDGPAWTAVGWALENLGRLPEAEEAYRTAVRHDPGQPWAMVGLATVLEKTGRPGEALDIYRSVAERAPQSGQMGPDMLEIVGWSCFKSGDLDHALALYRQALAVEPKRTAVRFDLALALVAAGQVDNALSEYRTGLRDTDDQAELRAHVEVALDDLLGTPVGASGYPAEALLRRALAQLRRASAPPAGDR
jgi:Flp pilus assembly protein TadD